MPVIFVRQIPSKASGVTQTPVYAIALQCFLSAVAFILPLPLPKAVVPCRAAWLSRPSIPFANSRLLVVDVIPICFRYVLLAFRVQISRIPFRTQNPFDIFSQMQRQFMILKKSGRFSQESIKRPPTRDLLQLPRNFLFASKRRVQSIRLGIRRLEVPLLRDRAVSTSNYVTHLDPHSSSLRSVKVPQLRSPDSLTNNMEFHRQRRSLHTTVSLIKNSNNQCT